MKSVENILVYIGLSVHIFEDNFTEFREDVSLEKIFIIVQENTIKLFDF